MTNAPKGVNGASINSLPDEYYSRFLSDVAKNRMPHPARSLLPLESTPGLVSLLAGKPNPETFPFISLHVTTKSPSENDQDITLTLGQEDLAEGLQYGATAGLPRLLEWLRGLQERQHRRRKDEGWDITVGSGSQDLICKATIAMVNPGDSVLVESPVYSGVIPIFHSVHCEQIEVETDADGIRTDSLRSLLEDWPSGKPKPRILYTIPYGCNPTGMTASLERRRETLRLAHEHDLIILEDDPYFYLYYGEAARYPSYFELELDQPVVGRVLRFDSFSKVLSAGIHVGFTSGPKQLLNAINTHTAVASLQSSSLTQAIILKLLQSWGYDGFQKHTEHVSSFYRMKRDVFERAMQTHLSGLAEWTPPEAGMFFWFKLNFNSPNAEGEGDSETVIRTNALEQGVLALPEPVFLPSGRKASYVRAAFSLLREDRVEEAVMWLRQTILDAREANAASEVAGT